MVFSKSVIALLCLILCLNLVIAKGGGGRGGGGGGRGGGGRGGGRGRGGSRGRGGKGGHFSSSKPSKSLSGVSKSRMVSKVSTGFMTARVGSSLSGRVGRIYLFSRYYYHGHAHYDGPSGGYHTCTYDVTNDVEFNSSVDSSVIFDCDDDYVCCDLDCCTTGVADWVWILITIVVAVIALFLIIRKCYYCRKSSQSKESGKNYDEMTSLSKKDQQFQVETAPHIPPPQSQYASANNANQLNASSNRFFD